jgi:hypothetical protein
MTSDVPEGHLFKSPPIHRWVAEIINVSLGGTAENVHDETISRPSGTHIIISPNPPMNRWAFNKCPCGTSEVIFFLAQNVKLAAYGAEPTFPTVGCYLNMQINDD